MSGNFENADASEDISSSASATLSTTSVSTPPEMRKEPNTAVAASLAAAAALRIAPPPPSVNPSAVIGSGSTPFPSILQSIPQTSSELTPPISDNLYGNPLWQTILRLQQYQNMASLNPFLAAAAAANTLSPDAAVAVAAVAAAQQQQQQQHQLQMATILAQAQAMQQAAASAAAAAAATSKPSTIHHPISPSTSTSVNINSPEENNSGINMGLYRDYLNKYAKTTSISTSNATILSESAQVVSKDNPLASQLFLSSGKLPSEQHLQHAAIQSMASSSTTTSNTSSLKLNIADLDPTSILTNATGTLNKLRSPICGGQSSQLASSPLPPKRQNSTSSSNTASSVPLFTSTAAMAATSSDYRSAAEGCGRGSSSITSHQNGRDKVFTCKICNRSFGYKHVLQNHERTHTGEKPFECKVCHKRFTRDHHLKTHMRLHTGEKPYHCTHCERQFVQVANLRRHLRVHTGEKPYKCDLCSSHFSDSNQLKAHILIHKGEKPFSCDHCSGKFRRRHHLMHHVCPKGGGGAVIIGEQDIQEDNMDDAIESEKTALLRKWPMPSPIVQPQPSSQSDKSECMESIEAPSAPVITMTDQKTGLLVQKQQQHQKIASIAITDTINPEVGVNVNSMSLFGIDTEKQRYRKAKDPKKRASNCTTAASGPILTSKQGNEETASVSSLEEVQGQTEPEDLSNKDSNN